MEVHPRSSLIAIVTLALATPLLSLSLAPDDEADANEPLHEIHPPSPGSVTREEGLEAWKRIYEVVSHPRCANCHVGEENVPMWSGPSYGRTRPHGMNITAGESRKGLETLECTTCHRTSDDFDTNSHAPPHFGIDWQLAPVEFEWFGKSSSEVCEQLKDPSRNGGRDWMGLARHLVVDAGHRGPVLWGWSPGGDREPAPYSLEEHLNDVLVWGAAGQPCEVRPEPGGTKEQD